MAAKQNPVWPVTVTLSGTDADGDAVNVSAKLSKTGKLTVDGVDMPTPGPMPATDPPPA